MIQDESGNDKIIFGEGVSFDDLAFSKSGNNMLITVKGKSTQGIRINNFYLNNNYKIENIEFADGSLYKYENNQYNASQLIQAMGSFAANSAVCNDDLSQVTSIDNEFNIACPNYIMK